LASDEVLEKEGLSQEQTAARLALMRGIQQVLKNGLGVLGISAPEQM
jgi:arginyl-tRNA synthetase